LRQNDLGVDLRVWSGTVDVVVPVHATSQLVPMLSAHELDTAEIRVRVRYQACDDRTCFVSREEEFVLEAGIREYTVPRIRTFAGSGQHFARHAPAGHMLRLAVRGALRRPLRTVVRLGSMLGERLRRQPPA
jgi:hypothetical protein